MVTPELDSLRASPIGRLERIALGQHAGASAFVPAPLPRTLTLSARLVYALDEATRSVGTLVGVGETLANPRLLIDPLMRREAVVSSRIEGTVASLSDLFMYEADRRVRRDVVEVHNYLAALDEGLRLMREQNLPVSMRLMNAMHTVLMQNGARGANLTPGSFRTDQVWIGADGTSIEQARFVPPPAYLLRDLVYDIETFANDGDVLLPPLVQCGMLHYQFEAVHPYWDGNGRIGRLLIILFLFGKGVLRSPVLSLSPYFERDRARYYDELFNLSATGDWERWLTYFLDGVRVQVNDTLDRARRVRDLHAQYTRVLQAKGSKGNDFRLLDEIFRSPVTTYPMAAAALGLSNQGARLVIDRLVKAGILHQEPDAWPRLFVSRELLDLLQADHP